jgi:hypothetical protein
MADVFSEMMTQIDELTSFVQQGAYLKLRRPLYTAVRWTVAGGATVPGVGNFLLFDRPTIVANAWGSGAAGAVIDDIDIPRWFNLNNRVMPDRKYYIAEFFSIEWIRRVVANTLNATFATDKANILNSNAFVEIRPRDKDIEWRYPLRYFGDYMIESPRTVNSADAQTIADTTHIGNDITGGKIPLYPDSKTPGILFDPKSTINVTLNIATAPVVITGETRTLFTFDGWFFREL